MATIGPDKQLSQCVDDFIKELEDDFQSPAVSKFQDYIPRCRKGVQFMEEVSERGVASPIKCILEADI